MIKTHTRPRNERSQINVYYSVNVHFALTFFHCTETTDCEVLYQRDLDLVLRNARKLRGKPYYINRQFPDEIEQARRSLYPIMKEFRNKGDHVKMVRDTLYVNGEPYEPDVTQ